MRHRTYGGVRGRSCEVLPTSERDQKQANIFSVRCLHYLIDYTIFIYK